MKTLLIAFALFIASQATFGQPPAIKIQRSGKGMPVLFLPGFTTPGTVWNETIRNLPTGTEAFTVSYAGFNGMTPIDTPWYPALKQELIEFIEKENLSNLTIIGHSMGGNLAVDLAAALPSRISKLILVDAIPCMRELMLPGVPVEQIQYKNPYNDQQLKMADEPFKQMATMMAGNMTVNASKVDTLVKWILEADRETYVYGYTDLLKLDLRPALKNIKAKTLILGATFPNAEITGKTFENQYANLENKTIYLAGNSKHFIMFDQPSWLYEKINTFISK
ncbi:MAG: alpha/beta fold hydrolase [Flavitalea sp.]